MVPGVWVTRVKVGGVCGLKGGRWKAQRRPNSSKVMATPRPTPKPVKWGRIALALPEGSDDTVLRFCKL